MHSAAVAALVGVSAVMAVPAPPAVTPPPALPMVNLPKRNATGGCTFTDADSASASKASCATITLSGITVPSGTTLDLTELEDNTYVFTKSILRKKQTKREKRKEKRKRKRKRPFLLTDCFSVVVFEGTTTWEYAEWEGPLFAVSGTGITVKGASGHQLDGQGAQWWDGEGDDGVTKPKFFQAHDLTDSTISGINILNPPHQVFSIVR